MKILKKRDLKQIVFIYPSDIGFHGFMEIYKKCIAEPFSVLVNDTTLTSNYPVSLRNNLII